MPYKNRVQLYKKISGIRKCPLIVYVTSYRQNASGQIGHDVIPQFTKLLSEIPKGSKEIDLLVVSNGGDPIVPWRIISMIREKYQKVGILLPFEAYSAATLLALGADEIIMHPFSNIGPVDPQLKYRRRLPGRQGGQDIEEVSFGSEDLRNYLDFVRSDVGITDQEQIEKAFEHVCNDVGPIPIGVSKRSTQLALSLSEKLLSLHLKDNSQVRAISEALNRSFYHHGYPLGMSEVKNIGLPVIDAPDGLETILWEIWTDIEDEMECDTPFIPLSILLQTPEAQRLLEVLQINLPSNIPQQLLPQILNTILSQIRIEVAPAINYNLFQATLETEWCKSEYRSCGKIIGTRMPDMNIVTSTIQTSTGWVFSKNTESPKEEKNG